MFIFCRNHSDHRANVPYTPIIDGCIQIIKCGKVSILITKRYPLLGFMQNIIENSADLPL